MTHPNLVEDEEALARIVKSATTIGVVGAKDESQPDAPAFAVPRRLQQIGYTIFPVNPKFARALGQPVFPSVASLARKVDILDVFRRIDAIPGLADEVLALPPEQRPSVFWMQTGILHPGAAERLAEAGIQVVQDRCLGVYAALYALRK